MFAKGALQTVMTLFGALLIGFASGHFLFKLLPDSNVENPAVLHMLIAALPALAGFLVGGAAWGVQMGKLAHSDERQRMALAGLMGFAPITLVLALGLGLAEPRLIVHYGDVIPIHRLFTLLFVPSAFLIAGVSAWAIGKGLRDTALAWSLFWRIGLTAAGTFLVVNVLMEQAGWVVGAPGAAERATMMTVMALGNLLATIMAGGVMGRLLVRT